MNNKSKRKDPTMGDVMGILQDFMSRLDAIEAGPGDEAYHSERVSGPALKVKLKSKKSKAKAKAKPEREETPSRALGDSTGDPNKVIVNITDGYMRNRMTLPREIYVKSGRDEFDYDEGVVMNEGRAYVIVDGDKYQQSNNQGRSNKIQVTTFSEDIEEGDTVVFTRQKGNVWHAVVKSGGATRKASKSKVSGNKSKGSGKNTSGTKTPKKKSSGHIQLFGKTPKAKSTSKAQKAGGWEDVLEATAKAVVKNNKAGFYNDAIDANRVNDDDFRVFLHRSENKRFKRAAKDEGLSLKAAVGYLHRACKKLAK